MIKLRRWLTGPLPDSFLSRQHFQVVFLYFCVVTVQTFIFTLMHKTNYLLIPLSVLPGILLGSAIWWLERFLVMLRQELRGSLSVFLLSFLLFFAHLIGYLLLSALLVSYPLGWLLERIWLETGTARGYGLFAANIMLVLAIISWLKSTRKFLSR